MSIWTGKFWKATAERAVSTAAQAALAGIGTDLVGVLDMDAVGILSLAGGGDPVDLEEHRGDCCYRLPVHGRWRDAGRAPQHAPRRHLTRH